MTTKRQTLTERAVNAAKADIYDELVTGFMLRVRGSGVKSYALFTRYPGSPNGTRRTIGRVGAISLADARQTARDWLALIKQGKDPADELQRLREENARKRKDTIASLAETYIATRVVGKMRQEARTVHNFRDVLIPLFGCVPVTELTSRDVSLALAEIEKLGTDHALVKLGVRKQLRRPSRAAAPCPTQARNLFVFLDGMLRWAAGTGDYGLDVSPLTRVSKAQRFGPAPRRERVLSDDEIGCVWRSSGTLRKPYRQLYRMLCLTGLRLANVVQAEWHEFDPKLTTWAISANKMKGKNGSAKKHVVPITSHMRDVLRELRRGNRGSFVFSVNGGLSPIAMRGKFKTMLDEAMAHDQRTHESKLAHFTNHDLRRTLRTRGAELGLMSAIVGEKMMAHTLPGVVGIYDQGDYLDERRKAHELWGEFVIKQAGGKVVRLRKAA